MLTWPRKTPGEILDYTCDWAAELAEGEAIETSVWTLLDSTGIAPELTVTNETLNPAQSIIWLANGVPKKKYHLRNRITTDAGRTIEQFLWLRVIERD
jgi:hypothetical protein